MSVTVRSAAVLAAAVAGFATAARHERWFHRELHRPRIGETGLGEPGEVLWYC